MILWLGVIPSLAMAGGVSDGGGGLINPTPADPQAMVYEVKDAASWIIPLWLNAKEAEFEALSPIGQSTSPYRVLFQSSPDVFEVLEKTPVELRMSEPCYDKSGVAWDGSAYATQADAICLSPFRMAPKLSYLNYHYETVALIIHELSHKVGANESEAQAIQQRAIEELHQSNFNVVLSSLTALGDPWGKPAMVSNDIQIAFVNAHPDSSHSGYFGMMSDLLHDLAPGSQPFQFARLNLLKRLKIEHLRAFSLMRQAFVLDPKATADQRASATHWLDFAFSQGNTASAWDVAERSEMVLPPFVIAKLDSTLAQSTLLHRASDRTEAWEEVKPIVTTLQELESSTHTALAFRFSVSVKP